MFWLLTEERGGQRAAFELLREFADLRGAAAAGRGPETPPRCRPPPYEVRRLLGECLGVTKDAEVALWLHEARGLDPVAVEHSGLAVALPSRGSYVPGWARFKGRPWTASAHRILVPMFSCNGKVESVHARAITKTEPSDKAASPAGYAVGGLVMAESLARRMLAGEADAVEMVRRVGLIVAEGVPDYLTWATHWSDAAEEAPGVIGILAGSWCEEIAARVPDGTLVIVRTHQDPAGGKYGQRISETLVARCDVRRLRIEHRPQVEGATP